MSDSVQVPDGWILSKLSSSTSLITKGATPTTYGHSYVNALVENGAYFFRGNNASVEGRFINSDIKYITSEAYDFLSRSQLHEGDCIISIVGSLGASFIVSRGHLPANINQNVALIRPVPNKLDTSFLSVCIQSVIQSQILKELTVQAQPSLSLKQVGDFHIPLPPLPEQKKIASILTSVDDVIEKTEAQISKLQDLKKGMMTELLTKGIGHIEFKDSPVGRIPVSWDVKKLGELFTFKNGVNASGEKFGQGIKFINLKEVLENDYLYPKNIPGSVTLEEKEIEQNTVNYGDVLFNRTSETQDELGLTAVYLGSEKVVFGGFVIRARPVTDVFLTEYLKYTFNSPHIRKEIITKGQGAVRANIGQTEMSQIYIPCPPHEEQKKISQMLTSIDDSIYSKQQKLSQTKSLKKALMNDLLTGRVRVSTTTN